LPQADRESGSCHFRILVGARSIRALVAIVVLVISGFLAGCCKGAPSKIGGCTQGDSYCTCDGHTAYSCIGNSYYGGTQWHPDSCEKECVTTAKGNSFCAEAANPVAECAGKADGKPTCYQNEISICQEGFPTPDFVITPHDLNCSPGFCVDGCGFVFCAMANSPDPRCNAPNDNTVRCIGDELVACRCGYVIGDTACGANLCKTVMGNGLSDTICVLSPTPDPNCNCASYSCSYCDRSVEVQCMGGYPVMRNPNNNSCP
jgi:hypothetical protein